MPVKGVAKSFQLDDRNVPGLLTREAEMDGRPLRGQVHPTIQEETLARAKKLTEAMTKTQMLSEIADNTELTKRQVSSVFDALESVIERHIKKGAVGMCTVPGLMKIKTIKKPAQKARKNVPNPFRPGELMDVKSKPASIRVKVLPLKKLKDMV